MPYSYLKTFDIAMLLSRWEGFGLAIAEYMAAEKNFVATRVDAIPTIVEDGVDGKLVNVDSPKEVADAVFYYNTHPVEAEKMRKKAKEKVIKQYEISRVVIQHKQLFNELMNS
jgi:glycosyltransferase involved in cell wall biosynthesis